MTILAHRLHGVQWLTAVACATALVYVSAARQVFAKDEAVDLSKLERIEVEPQQLHLGSPRDEAILLVTGVFSDGTILDLTDSTDVASANTKVAEFRDGALHLVQHPPLRLHPHRAQPHLSRGGPQAP